MQQRQKEIGMHNMSMGLKKTNKTKYGFIKWDSFHLESKVNNEIIYEISLVLLQWGFIF